MEKINEKCNAPGRGKALQSLVARCALPANPMGLLSLDTIIIARQNPTGMQHSLLPVEEAAQQAGPAQVGVFVCLFKLGYGIIKQVLEVLQIRGLEDTRLADALGQRIKHPAATKQQVYSGRWWDKGNVIDAFVLACVTSSRGWYIRH